MIPLRDTIRARRFPVVNTILIGLNVIVFLNEPLLGPTRLRRLFLVFGLVPARFWAASGVGRWVPLFTSMFLHGGWMHIISNMLALYIFGDNVEDRMGRWRYLLFYLLSGSLAGLAHLWAYPSTRVPTVGASGAIAGVLGAYLILFPTARVLTLVPLFFWFSVIEIPAVFYLGFWFVSQLFSGVFALAGGATFQGGGVAWWAHIGGFVSGLLLAYLFAARRRREDHDEHSS
jgi:membrane associated rhomboid family serine protease